MSRAQFLHDLASVATLIIGESSVGSHLSVLTDLFNDRPEKELYVVVEESALYSFGLVTGLARTTYSLAAVAGSYRALRLTQQLVVQLLQPFEAVRSGTEVFFHSMACSRPHWLDQYV